MSKSDFLIIITLLLLFGFIIKVHIMSNDECNYNSNQELSQIDMNNLARAELAKSELAKDEVANIPIDSMSIDHFGNINFQPNYYDNQIYEPYSNSVSHTISGLTGEKTAEELIAQPTLYDTLQDPNFNNLNNIPVLISPDPPGPNSVPASSPSYYANRVKLIDNPDSKLLKIYEQNYKNLENRSQSCNLLSRQAPPMVNGTFDGYNAYENLDSDSYANVTAIGKGMLTPYTSFPVPS